VAAVKAAGVQPGQMPSEYAIYNEKAHALMDTLVLSYSDLKRLVDIIGKDSMMRDCIARLRQGLAEIAAGHRQACPPRAGFVIGDGLGRGVIENMPYYQEREGMTLKTISYKPLNNSSNWASRTTLLRLAKPDITATETKRRRYPSGPTTTRPETRSGQTDPAVAVFKKWLPDDTLRIFRHAGQRLAQHEVPQPQVDRR
jgi:hypothetical protein